MNPAEPSSLLSETDSCTRLDVAGSVMDGLKEEMDGVKYTVYKSRWLMLVLFVIYSASNSLQWTQYTIIQDVVVKYYSVPSTVVSWTSMVYMITYVPLIFPASWLLDKTTCIQLDDVYMSYIVIGPRHVAKDLRLSLVI
ncbi:putative MFS-type transporter C09D4.1 [Papilio xuthus]|uniref:Putative MFS-type transporter C09D4.1 n=1 Tax=Papilio xuthus TaxID=66420 RepID=A0A194QA63_PAPXU|nr:putative MFS-type transporter C09D4.1 [Papilio xuthus]